MSQCIGIDLGETHTRVAIQSGGVTAASCAAQMDGLVQSKDSEWKQRAQGLCGYAEFF
jgi:molecular chaperone DnaK (HSP70)